MTLHDVVRTLVRAAHQHGQIGEQEASDALAAIDQADPVAAEAAARPPELSDVERQQLADLQAKQAAADAYQAPAPAQLAPVPAVPGGGFNQQGTD